MKVANTEATILLQTSYFQISVEIATSHGEGLAIQGLQLYSDSFPGCRFLGNLVNKTGHLLTVRNTYPPPTLRTLKFSLSSVIPPIGCQGPRNDLI